MPSANRITLLRDADGDGVAEVRSPFLIGLNSPFGMVLVEQTTGGVAGRFGRGMFVGQHGSWNRQPRSGYKVIFVPFTNGILSGDPVDVLTGFLDERDGDSRGRPVGVVIDRRRALLVAMTLAT